MAKTQKQNAKRKRRTAKRNAQLYKKNKKNGGGTDPRDTRFSVVMRKGDNGTTYKVYTFTNKGLEDIRSEYDRLDTAWKTMQPLDYNRQPDYMDVINNIFPSIHEKDDKDYALQGIKNQLFNR